MHYRPTSSLALESQRLLCRTRRSHNCPANQSHSVFVFAAVDHECSRFRNSRDLKSVTMQTGLFVSSRRNKRPSVSLKGTAGTGDGLQISIGSSQLVGKLRTKARYTL